MAQPDTAHETATGGRRTSAPFRADHVGSLLRPPELLQARQEFAAGNVTREQLRAVEDEAIRAAVKMQRDVGLQSATDGEFRRASWHMDFIYELGGIEKAPGDITVHFRNEQGEIEYTPAAIHVADKVHLDHPIFAQDFAFLQAAVDPSVTPKLTVPSPSMVHYRGGAAAIDPSVYSDVEAFWSDLTAAYAAQVKAIAGMGGRYLQFDDTSLAYLNDPRQRAEMATKGEDAEHLHETYIRHLNEALADKPAELTVTTHLCRGNFRSSWVAEGGYDFVAEALFGDLNVDGFFLEYDDARSGGFAPLRFVPKDKLVVLGLVTTKRGALEDKDQLKRRIEEAAQYVPIEQLCLSPQCGFSSTVDGNALTYDEQVAKLELVVETAAEVWG
jgi:5-methyltetrahydropteroyltriglutamate--homocysteine methyltransferase